jgi:pimeloyl-ACP methyl ester carboxylesterase
MSPIDANGISLYYDEKGSGEPLVFVHGIVGDYRSWKSQLEALSPNFRVVTYSRRTSYPNKNQGDFKIDTIQNNSEDLAVLTGKLGMVPFHLVGHSYGGFVAAYFAQKHPEMLRSLVLVEPAVSTVFFEVPTKRSELLKFLLLHFPTALSAMNFTSGARKAIKALSEQRPEDAARLFVDTIQNRLGGFDQLPKEFREIVLANVNTIMDVNTPPPEFTKEDLGKISTHTLLIKGATSHKLLTAISENVASCIPSCKLVTVVGSGHFPQVEKTAEFNRRILEFLQMSP